MSRKAKGSRFADEVEYDEFPDYEAQPRVREAGAPRRPCSHCNSEVEDDGLGDLVHVTSGRYQCGGNRGTVAELGRAVVPGTDRPKRNWGRTAPQSLSIQERRRHP